MTAEVPRPAHRLSALTTYELRDYRKLLTDSLKDGVIGSAPIAVLVFEALYPEHELVCEGDRYATMCGGSLIITDSTGELARYVGELHSLETLPGALVAESEEPLSARN